MLWGGGGSAEPNQIKINISKDSEQTVEQNVTQTIHVTAQGQCSQSVCLNVYLKNEDGSAATDIDAVNLLTSDQLTDKNTQKTIDETLKDSVTLNNGTKASPTAEWKNDKDDNGTVTSKYLQITMPADATAINFDMQLQYRTDEASYTKEVLVEAKAFEEEQDITEAAKRADESKENEATVVWEGQAVSQSESEAADENTDGENNINTVSETGLYTLYFEQNTIDDSDSAWNNATQISVYAFNSDSDHTSIQQMYKVPESDSKNIWKITFDKKWTHVVFLTGNDWTRACNQTENIQIEWSLNSPCYKLTGEAASDEKKRVDTPFEYQEKPLDPEYIKAEDGSYNITNKKTGTLKIIKKTGKDDFLEGAEFTLYTDSDTTEVAKDYLGNNLTGTTGTNGELIFNNIITGTEENPITYYLKEVKTKAGYVLLKEPIKITLPYKYKAGDIVNGTKVKEGGVTWNLTYTIVNDKAFDLPASGNKGIYKFIVIGITTVLVGGYLLTKRKKRRREQ